MTKNKMFKVAGIMTIVILLTWGIYVAVREYREMRNQITLSLQLNNLVSKFLLQNFPEQVASFDAAIENQNKQ